MKFVCSKCSQKHSIADDLLAGHKFVRVRCQRCGQRISVRPLPPAFASRTRRTDKPTPPAPELPPQASPPAGVTSGILDMLAMAEDYFGGDDAMMALEDERDAAVPPPPVPALPVFVAPAHERTLQIVLPPPMVRRSGWRYVAAAAGGATLAVAAMLLALGVGVQRPASARIVVGAGEAGASRSHAVGAALATPSPEWDVSSWRAEVGADSVTETDSETDSVTDSVTDSDGDSVSHRVAHPVRVRPTHTVPHRTHKPHARTKQHVVWDEVECMLADHPPAVCNKWIKKHEHKSTAPVAATTAEPVRAALTRNLINAGIDKVRWRVDQCGTRGFGAGNVVVSLKVDKQGVVKQALIKSAPSSKLASCVHQTVASARFAPTRIGGTFSYLFSFR